MTVREQKELKEKFYKLGYFEDDEYVWRCNSCKEPKSIVECNCTCCNGRCEWCCGRKKLS